ncbi:MAG: protein TolR [Azospirillaceae bacterium]|nr:protein TolR [Azospirillaceae bacterium]
MGAALSGKQSTGRGRRRARPMADINVTPMVDVMLVLLIIFMVTAPLLTVGVPVDLPKSNAAALPGQDEPLVVSIRGNGDVYLNETQTDLNDLIPRLQAISQNNADARIFVRGDKTLAYGRIIEVMGAISSAGYKKVALISEVPDHPARR